MIKSIAINGYKSIEKLSLDFGRVNVFIGENGAGKSNILEAIALAGAAEAGKLDNEFLTARGIRVTSPMYMRPLFDIANQNNKIRISAEDNFNRKIDYDLFNDNAPYSAWTCEIAGTSLPLDKEDMPIITEKLIKRLGDRDRVVSAMKMLAEAIVSTIKNIDEKDDAQIGVGGIQLALEDDAAVAGEVLLEQSRSHYKSHRALSNFVIFSPENSALRGLEREGQIEPLGVNGEGLSKLLQVMASDQNQEPINFVKTGLRLFGWFEDFSFPVETKKFSDKILLKDCFLSKDAVDFDQRSANEGFLFSAFYFALFSSRLTPEIFAIDNIDASLNPKMCEKLMKELVSISKKNQKQVFLTTHNPSILDGININDSDQRLFVVSRGASGGTAARKVEFKSGTSKAIRLSSAFMNGALGGVPRNF